MQTQLLTGADKNANKAPSLIDEQVSHSRLELVEKKDAPNKVFARGEFGHAAKATANGRLYKHHIWESNIKRLKPNLKERKVIGELDHPTDGRTALSRGSHVVTDLWLEGDRVMGEAEILDTAKGRDLKAYLRAGVPIGISSRGYGSTKPNEEGKDEVQEDYKLVTFDFVAEPADNTAYPEAFFEGVEIAGMEEQIQEGQQDEDKKKAEEIAERVAARKQGEEASAKVLREEFAGEIVSQIENLREEIEAKLREEKLSDPEEASAKKALEGVQESLRPFLIPEGAKGIVEEKDAEIHRLRKQLSEAELQMQAQDDLIGKLKNAAKEAGYKFHLERVLHDDEDADMIRQMVGDVTQYESPKELEGKVEEAREEILARRQQEMKVKERQEAKQNELREKNKDLAEGLEKALTVNRELALQLYAAKRLTNHPKGAKIMRMLERAGFESREQIDDLIEDFREPERDPDDLESVRNRVRSHLGGGQEHLQEDTENSQPRSSDGPGGYNGLGVSLEELRKLSKT